MNTNEASLGQSTVQKYSTTEKTDLEHAVFALECTARWLDNGSDPAQAAEQIRLAIAQIKGCIADCDVNHDPADARQPAAIDKQEAAVTREEVEQDERGALNFVELNDLMDTMQHAPHGVGARRKDAVVFADTAQRAALARAASTSANVAQGFLTDEQKSAVTQAADVMGANGFHWVEETLRQIVSANVAQGAEAVETCKCQRLGDWKGFHHPLCDTAPPAQTALTDAEIAACAIQACECRTAADGWIFDNTDQLREFLAAAQSASGDAK
jgi:hypothetical protein